MRRIDTDFKISTKTNEVSLITCNSYIYYSLEDPFKILLTQKQISLLEHINSMRLETTYCNEYILRATNNDFILRIYLEDILGIPCEGEYIVNKNNKIDIVNEITESKSIIVYILIIFINENNERENLVYLIRKNKTIIGTYSSERKTDLAHNFLKNKYPKETIGYYGFNNNITAIFCAEITEWADYENSNLGCIIDYSLIKYRGFLKKYSAYVFKKIVLKYPTKLLGHLHDNAASVVADQSENEKLVKTSADTEDEDLKKKENEEIKTLKDRLQMATKKLESNTKELLNKNTKKTVPIEHEKDTDSSDSMLESKKLLENKLLEISQELDLTKQKLAESDSQIKNVLKPQLEIANEKIKKRENIIYSSALQDRSSSKLASIFNSMI